MTKDPLSDVLSLVRLNGALIFEIDLTGEWCIAHDLTVNRFASLLPAGTTHIIGFHVVLEGPFWIRLASAEGVAVPVGHAVVLTQNSPYEISDRLGRKAVAFDALLGRRALADLRRVRLNLGPGPTTRLLCGILGYDRRVLNPLYTALPPALHVDLGARMQTLVPYAVDNALDDSPGAAGLRERLAELLFLGAVRVYMNNLPNRASGWLAGLRDPVIGRALQALHAEPTRRWSVDELAVVAASSRSALAARFTEMLGLAPMHYLARLRMSLAARQLTDSRKSLAAIAEEVGYDSAAAFQRAFKRDFHMPPAAWRRHAAQGAGSSESPRGS